MSDAAWMVRARTFIGTAEIKGPKHNPVVLGFWKSAHLGFKDDETPWCAGFTNAQLEECGIVGTRSGMAKSFLSWGVPLKAPVPGCIVVFHRPPNPNSGHVAFFDSFVKRNGVLYVRVLGGNQGDKVSYALFRADTVAGYRWPKGVPLPSASATVNAGGTDAVSPPMTLMSQPMNAGATALPPFVQKVLGISTAVGTAVSSVVAAMTDWKVILAFGVVCLAGYALYLYAHSRAGKE